jgi:hypothetical protein
MTSKNSCNLIFGFALIAISMRSELFLLVPDHK